VKAKQRENNFRSIPGNLFRTRACRHEQALAFNMSTFNFTDGRSRTFPKNEYARSNV
jgi:hypothetical protein